MCQVILLDFEELINFLEEESGMLECLEAQARVLGASQEIW